MRLYRVAIVVLLDRVRRDRMRVARADCNRGWRRRRVRAGRALHRARRRAARRREQEAPLMARKLRGFERVLDVPALFAVAYGEIASSLYIALGIVAAQALGLTPLVLLLTGPPLPHGVAVVRGGHGGAPGDGWRGDLRAEGVQRPRRLRHRLGALPRLPDRDGAVRALPAALPRRRALLGVAPGVALGRADRVPRHRGDRRHAPLPPHAPAHGRARSRDSRPDRPGGARAARCRVPPLAGDAARGLRLRERPGVGRPRLRAPARDARVHGPRDRSEPGRGGARAGPHASALALLRDRARRARDGADRRHRPVRVPGYGRRDRARRRVARGAARRHRRRVRRASCRASSWTRCGWRSASRARSSCSAPRRRRSPGITRLTLLARRARLAPARVRAPRAARARLERGDPDRGRARDRRDRRHRGRGGRRSRVPRERLLVRRPPRLHGGAARRHLAAGSGSPRSGARSGPGRK